MKRKTGNIAVVTAYTNSFSFYEVYLLNGFEKKNSELSEKYSINQYSTGGNNQKKKNLIKALVSESLADGVISMFMKFDAEDLEELRKHNIPVVFIDEDSPGQHEIKLNNYKGAYDATQYLIKKGRKNIALVSGSMGPEDVGVTPKERFDAFKKALADNNMAFDPKRMVEVVHYSFEEGEQALAELLKKDPTIDAVFSAAGDMTALGVLDEALRQKIEVPQQISIVGYDDINMAALSRPALTTVKQPIVEMGYTAFELLCNTIAGKVSEPETIVFEPKLIVRDSA